MFVCLCNAVTDHQIRESLKSGEVRHLRDLERELGVGIGCGRCSEHAREILREESAMAARPPIAAPRRCARVSA